jgi:hypothetical protein
MQTHHYDLRLSFLRNPFISMPEMTKQEIEKEKRKKGDTIPYVGKHRTPKRKYPLPR